MRVADAECGAGSAVVASANSSFRKRILESLQSTRWQAEEALGGAEALAKVESGGFRALLLDRWLPDLDVGELAATVKARFPQVEVFVVDSESGGPLIPEELMQTSQAGDLLGLIAKRQNFLSIAGPESEHPPLQPYTVLLPDEDPLPGMIGNSQAMQRVYRLARLVIPRDTTVLLTGETGTGKELVARAIHDLGPRGSSSMVIINCAALPDTLMEAELFGFARGSFTGAMQSRMGRIQSAHGGTVFLDEVSELPLATQAKLLRFLQEGELQRLGSTGPIQVDVRVIAATNANLARRVAEGRFREDLYYRLNVFTIEVLPLRERRKDIVPLAQHFLTSFCQQAGVPPRTLSPPACRLLEQYSWPGNVRELKNMVERAFILADRAEELTPDHLCLHEPRK